MNPTCLRTKNNCSGESWGQFYQMYKLLLYCKIWLGRQKPETDMLGVRVFGV
jgi:hypothetical protein